MYFNQLIIMEKLAEQSLTT